MSRIIQPDGTCRFCQNRIGGCLACQAEFTRLKIEYEALEQQAVRELIANPRFREILDKILADEREASPPSLRREGAKSTDIFAFLELDTPECLKSQQEQVCAPETASPKRRKTKKQKEAES